VLLRSRSHPGNPFSARKKAARFHPEDGASVAARLRAAGRRVLRPEKARRMAGRAIRFDAEAHRRHPAQIIEMAPGWLMTTSRWLPWTNNPCLLRRSLFLDLLDRAAAAETRRRVNGFKNFEIEVNGPWWRDQELRIVQGPGIFTHDRIGDRGYA